MVNEAFTVQLGRYGPDATPPGRRDPWVGRAKYLAVLDAFGGRARAILVVSADLDRHFLHLVDRIDRLTPHEADFPDGWATASEHATELILCDLSMPGADALDGVEGMGRAAPAAKLIVVTGREDDRLLMALFDLGVASFVPKSASGQILEAAIRLLLAGGRYLPPRIYDLARATGSQIAVREGSGDIARLTDRQIDVLHRMAQGGTNKEIALALNVSPATVKTHAAAIIAALGAENRTEPSAKARGMGLI